MEIIKAEPSQIGKFDNFNNLEEMTKFANTLISSGILPPNYKTAESVIATIIQGKELGLKAMIAASLATLMTATIAGAIF